MLGCMCTVALSHSFIRTVHMYFPSSVSMSGGHGKDGYHAMERYTTVSLILHATPLTTFLILP